MLINFLSIFVLRVAHSHIFFLSTYIMNKRYKNILSSLSWQKGKRNFFFIKINEIFFFWNFSKTIKKEAISDVNACVKISHAYVYIRSFGVIYNLYNVYYQSKRKAKNLIFVFMMLSFKFFKPYIYVTFSYQEYTLFYECLFGEYFKRIYYANVPVQGQLNWLFLFE